MEENKEMLEEAGKAVMDRVDEITNEVEITQDDGHPFVKAAIIGAVALGGAVAGYLFKRHRDNRWMKDFDDGDDYRPAVEEPEDNETSEE